MKYNTKKVSELVESFINGNISWVKGKVKSLNKVEFAMLCYDIVNRTDNNDFDQIAFRLGN